MANKGFAHLDSVTGKLPISELSGEAASSSFNGGSFNIGIVDDAAYADVDAVRVSITFNASSPGKYLVTFIFTYAASGTAALTLDSLTAFRLTDGVNNSNNFSLNIKPTAILIDSNDINALVNISSVFTFASSGSKTVKLQKKNITSSGVVARKVQASADSEIGMYAIRVSN